MTTSGSDTFTRGALCSTLPFCSLNYVLFGRDLRFGSFFVRSHVTISDGPDKEFSGAAEPARRPASASLSRLSVAAAPSRRAPVAEQLAVVRRRQAALAARRRRLVQSTRGSRALAASVIKPKELKDGGASYFGGDAAPGKATFALSSARQVQFTCFARA